MPQGRVVPTADNLVTFEVTGPGSVAGVGNGNPSDHDPDQAQQRHAFHGLCMVVVRAGADGARSRDGHRPRTDAGQPRLAGHATVARTLLLQR